ncbi:protease [Candidatus Saccharibacteria bacterium CG11_big_fil_rev_8_21_14_0_20_41_19]|nr:M48 family metalloprotease [Candidatus Saccharibacteria bacterium]OIP86119.1 MAG: protease [Candidatus Saccharibacteria bacterium CG2_30_41_52]PIQ70644.1 MAG: protease [Candidatus Saccharibacteria bacterium CG11_big_fil_rev_8_21_14_0_20_41_19]PIZ59563.1 MAG: protease [Candidatus Saccharibacteria bacterium CG_4_10_14_0_2_um_filter_41_11]PJC29745.1 MAG: protease [Candidatus Saccharibacteria bacterium CG_4_9_14_0_2_um_filter_41_9]PJE66200.1 MAG: protease [Candidatus Saccharibacteria bacterium 
MYKAIAANKRNTILIMAVFVGLISAIGYVVSYIYGDSNIAIWVIIGAALYALIQYYLATSLAVAMTGAKQIEKRDNPRFYRIVENLAITTGMQTPKIYIIDDPAPNAFATGRDPRHAIVAATTGLIDIMSDSELEAVMAHEMGHVQNYDIRISMITFGLVSAIGFLTDIVLRMMFYGGDRDKDNNSPWMMFIGLIVLILAPIIAVIVQMAVSRQREYLADATSAMTTRNPEAMVSALQKLKTSGRPMKRQNGATAHLYISNPLKAGFLGKMFSTHPPIEDRIARLRDNANKF